jgi:hypothetical protein
MNMSEADFNQFLDDASQEVEQKELSKLRVKIIIEACDDALDYYDVPTTYRFDPSRRTEQEMIQGDDALFESSAEGVYVTRAAMLVAVWDHSHDLAELTELKKQLMADIHVELGVERDSAWMKFIDGFAKGQALDFDSVDDVKYLIAAQATTDKNSRERKKYSIVYTVIVELIGEDSDAETFSKYLATSIELSTLHNLKEHEKSAKIDETARKYNIPKEHIIKIVATVDDLRQNSEE